MDVTNHHDNEPFFRHGSTQTKYLQQQRLHRVWLKQSSSSSSSSAWNTSSSSSPPSPKTTSTALSAATTTTAVTTSTTNDHQRQTLSLKWMDFHVPDKNHDHLHTPVLLLHGLLGSKRNFASLASMLGKQLDKPRRIVGVDLRNHGDSKPHLPDMTYTSMAHDVLEFLNSQNLDKIILVGHSMGGKVAKAISLLYPERVEGLVVLDIAPVTYTSEDPHWKAVEDILHAMNTMASSAATSTTKTSTITKTDLDKKLRKSIPDPALRAFVLTNYDNRNQSWKIPIHTIVEQLEHIAGFDINAQSQQSQQQQPKVLKYDGDVFIIHGGQSRFVRHAYMERIAEYFPNHMLTTIRGAGHWVHAEAPDDTIALLKSYLDR